MSQPDPDQPRVKRSRFDTSREENGGVQTKTIAAGSAQAAATAASAAKASAVIAKAKEALTRLKALQVRSVPFYSLSRLSTALQLQTELYWCWQLLMAEDCLCRLQKEVRQPYQGQMQQQHHRRLLLQLLEERQRQSLLHPCAWMTRAGKLMNTGGPSSEKTMWQLLH